MTIQTFLDNIKLNTVFIHNDGTDLWKFGENHRLICKNVEYLILAKNNEDIELGIEIGDNNFESFVYLFENGEVTFFAFSLNEVFNRKDLLKINRRISKSKKTDFSEYISQYEFDPGCLYWIASGIYTSIFDEKNYNIDRNKIAINLH